MKTKKGKTYRSVQSERGIIPSQNAVRYVAHQLRAMQHMAQKDAMVYERGGNDKAAYSLGFQADDMRQVAQFLEERLMPE